MSGHTPGPLGFVHSATTTANGGFHVYLTDSSGRKIAALWGGVDEKIANVHLFAASPELLGLLQELIDIEGPQPGTSGWAIKVRAAIAKATGAA